MSLCFIVNRDTPSAACTYNLPNLGNCCYVHNTLKSTGQYISIASREQGSIPHGVFTTYIYAYIYIYIYTGMRVFIYIPSFLLTHILIWFLIAFHPVHSTRPTFLICKNHCDFVLQDVCVANFFVHNELHTILLQCLTAMPKSGRR